MRLRIERACRPCLAAVALLPLSAGGSVAAAAAETPSTVSKTLRVCADPNNLPYSNKEGEGFENKLAELIARKLGKKGVTYTWHAQRRGFFRNTLNAYECDVVMGVPNLDMIGTTRPYYSSSYVFVSREDAELDFSSINAPELRDLRIGVHLIGDDGSNTPPAHVLGERGIVDNVVGYTIYGDYREDSPPSRLIKDVARGKIDVAAVWGPLAGYYAKRSDVPLRIEPITDTVDYLPLVFRYPIAMGVRKYDEPFKQELNEVIMRSREEIKALLDSYGVPQS